MSPGLTVYSNEPLGHVIGGGSGTHIIMPTLRLFGSKPGLILNIASTVVSYLCAIENNVSPGLTVYSNEPLGHVIGGGVGSPGIQIT